MTITDGLVAVVLTLGSAASAFSQQSVVPAENAIEVELVARAIQPGELLVLNIAVAADLEGIRVSVFGKPVPFFAVGDHRFQALAGVDLEQRAGRYTITVEGTDAGRRVDATKAFTVAAHAFPTRRLNVLPDYVNPPPEQLSRINRDSEFLREVYAHGSGARLWSDAFVRPVPQASNSAFGTRSVYNGQPRSPHAGADFLSPAGTPIHAPNAGRVVAARNLFFTGKTVIINHGLGLFSLLAHLSQLDVHEGDIVATDQVVGLAGATGRVTGAHLHWALSVSGARVNPLSALALLGKK